MKLLFKLDSKNYEDNYKEIYREASRAIIIKNNKIAMVKSLKEGFYKFPGGGIYKNETKTDALIREVLEETGLCVKKESIREYAYTLEKRKSEEIDNCIFLQKSYYYFVDVEDFLLEQRLTEDEKELNFVLEWIDLKEVYFYNSLIEINKDNRFVERETKVLESLIKEIF